MSLVTTYPDVTVKPHWLRSGWWDFLQEFWDDLADDGRLTDLEYDTPSPDGRPDTGSLGVVATLAPGATQRFPFWITWYFPNRRNSWKGEDVSENADLGAPVHAGGAKRFVRNHYATRFDDAWAVATLCRQRMAASGSGHAPFSRGVLRQHAPALRPRCGLRQHRARCAATPVSGWKTGASTAGKAASTMRAAAPEPARTSGAMPIRPPSCSRRWNARCAGSSLRSKPSRMAT